jgi:uncharacterized protein YxjI
MENPLDLDEFTVRRIVFRLFGAGFQVFDAKGEQVAYSDQRAFRLKEDIRVHAGTSDAGGAELLAIRARQVIDFSASYDVVDTLENVKVGAWRRRGFSSMVRDSWELLDADDRPIGQLREKSLAGAMLRRFINLIPQVFVLTIGDREVATMKQRFNPFVYKLDVEQHGKNQIDGRLLVAGACLIAAIEGRQGN